MESFGKYLRKLRQKKKISLRALAKQIDWEPAYISDIERDRRSAPLRNMVIKIANALEIDPSRLIELSQQNRGKLEIELEKATPSHIRLATLLALVWDDLSDQEIGEVIAILSKCAKEQR